MVPTSTAGHKLTKLKPLPKWPFTVFSLSFLVLVVLSPEFSVVFLYYAIGLLLVILFIMWLVLTCIHQSQAIHDLSSELFFVQRRLDRHLPPEG